MIQLRGNPALHLLDRYAGVPAVATLGRLRRRRALPAKIETIGLLKGGAIGDTVLLSAVIADLRKAFADAKLILFAGESNYEMACMLDGIDKVVKAPTGNPLRGFKAMRSARVDVMIDFGQWSRLEALYAISSKSAYTIGFRTPDQHRHAGFDRVVEHSASKHELENYRELVRALGIEATHRPFLRPTAGSSPIIANEDYAVFHLWPGGRRRDVKQWPEHHWTSLIGEMTEWGLQIVLTGALADWSANETIIADLPATSRSAVRNVAGSNLQQTVSTLAGARITVSVDTGIMHLASALGAPLVALHGPTSSKRWGPLNECSVALDTPLPEGGYISLGWESLSPAPACMEAISYEMVREACALLLRKRSDVTASVAEGEPAEFLKSALP